MNDTAHQPPMPPAAPAADDGASAFDAMPVEARLSRDCFCIGCGTNLLDEPIRRDPRSGLFLVRCPGCGRFDATDDPTRRSSVWLRRLGAVALLGWVVLLLLTYGTIASFQGGLNVSAAVEMHDIDRIRQAVADGHNYYRPDYLQRRLTESGIVMAIIAAAEAALGFIATALAAVAMPHWRRRGHAVLLLVLLLLGGLIIAIPFVIEPETASVLGRWLPLAAIYTLLFFVAGMAGAYLGRPIARLAARLLLPAKLRVVMSYLWVVDGKAPPEAGGRD